MVTTGTIRFPHFGQRVVRSMRSSRFLHSTQGRNFCSIRALRPQNRRVPWRLLSIASCRPGSSVRGLETAAAAYPVLTQAKVGLIQNQDVLSTQRRGRKIRMTSHPKRPRDPNQLAKSIIDIARQGRSPTAIPRRKSWAKAPRRSPGGRLEGPREARPGAAALTAEQRAEIARVADLISPLRPAGQALVCAPTSVVSRFDPETQSARDACERDHTTAKAAGVGIIRTRRVGRRFTTETREITPYIRTRRR
jgi:hypothetical protein